MDRVETYWLFVCPYLHSSLSLLLSLSPSHLPRIRRPKRPNELPIMPGIHSTPPRRHARLREHTCKICCSPRPPQLWFDLPVLEYSFVGRTDEKLNLASQDLPRHTCTHQTESVETRTELSHEAPKSSIPMVRSFRVLSISTGHVTSEDAVTSTYLREEVGQRVVHQ